MKNIQKICGIIFFLAMAVGCKEPYTAPVSSPPTGYLVVEGFINNGEDATTITLTRTTQLYDSVRIIYETNADVSVESDNNQSFRLSETTGGVYTASQLFLDPNQKYRVHIKTKDNREYASDYTPVKTTPAIDSISWKRENDGVQLYINTHDASGDTKYYQWKYEETWEFYSSYLSSIEYLYESPSGPPVAVKYRYPDHTVDTSIFRCWNTVSSTNILLGSTEKLTQDVIYLPLVFIEPASEKLSVLYSINVKQYALSHDAYNFYQKMKKNTEQLGSIFDPQPSELQGNVHCISDPKETVIGFIEVSHQKKQRIFISNKDVPGWGYSQGCSTIVIDNIPDSILKYGVGLIPTIPSTLIGMDIKDFFATTTRCVDCTLRGTNQKPDFWP